MRHDLCQDEDGEMAVKSVQRLTMRSQTNENGGPTLPVVGTEEEFHFFEYRAMRFFFDADVGAFVSNELWLDIFSYTAAHVDHARGLSTPAHRRSKLVFGPNLLDVRVKSLGRLFLNEVCHVNASPIDQCLQTSNPFYLFQAMSAAVWTYEGYVSYSVALVFVSMCCAIDSILGTKKVTFMGDPTSSK